MSNLSDCVEAFKDLKRNAHATKGCIKSWQRFKTIVEGCQDNPPEQLAPLLAFLKKNFRDSDRREIAILDHGCGGGFSLMFLAALGYTNVRGVDVVDKGCTLWNGVMSKVLGQSDKNFIVYDGARLPFEDGSIDLVFSQQVLEHVSPSVFETFYEEEARALRQGGFALHNVPHRLVPFESHSRTWFLHTILPYSFWVWLIKQLGIITPREEYHLYLRWPWIHRRLAKAHFGDVKDITHQRLQNLSAFEEYDGPRKLRIMISRICGLPAVGSVFARVLANFVMIDTVSKMKYGSHHQASTDVSVGNVS